MLTIEGLSKTYEGGVRALVDVSLEIPKGMFGLLGPNGAGKSTLMRTLATLQDADAGSATLHGVDAGFPSLPNGDAGSVTLGDIDILGQKDRVRRVLGYLPQEFGVYSRISIETMLDHFATLKGLTGRGERGRAVESLLRMTNLWELRGRKLGTLSGGMRQRFGIAQALLGEPALVIVDEPTAGLDPEERHRFLNLLSEIGESVVVILSTHIVEDVAEVCSRMAIIDRGHVLRAGEPRLLMDELEGRVWQREIARSELVDYESRWSILSTRLVSGRTVVRVLSKTPPAGDFEPVSPELVDVYFATLAAGSRSPE